MGIGSRRHRKLGTNLGLGDVLNSLAQQARSQGTSSSGSQTFHTDPSDPDNDVTTVVGPAAGAAGVAQWVGDTTPPGVPTGITGTSKQGIIYIAWDGTLEGGVPEDFGQVNLLVDGAPVGRLVRAGTLPVDGLTAGATVQVTATAQDLARAQDGAPAPNVSGACAPVPVTVESAVSQADLDNAQAQIDQAKTDITTAQDAADNALATATTANTMAGQAAATATAAKPLIQSDVPTTDEQVRDRLWIDTASRAYAWTGTANASPSTESVDGVVHRTNLAVNPRLVQSGTIPVHGSFSLAWVSGGGVTLAATVAGDRFLEWSNIPVTPGLTYCASATLTRNGAPTMPTNGWLFGVWSSSTGTILGTFLDSTEADGRRSITGVAPAGAATLGVRLYAPSTTVGSATWQQLLIEQASAVGDYFDGDTTDTPTNTPKRWNGTAWLPVTDGAATAAAAAAAAAQNTATAAQTTANGKNKVFTQTSEPDHTGLVLGDLWRVLTVMGDGSRRVTGQQVWNGTAFAADQMVADSILVPGSAGTVSIGDGAITTPKLLAGQIDANTVLATDSVTAPKISATTEMLTKLLSARKIVADDIDVGALAAAIVTSTEFHTADGRLGFDSTNGFYAKDANGNYVFKVDLAGKLTAVGAEISGTLSNVTALSSTVIDEDGIEIRGTGWKFPYPDSIPEPITSYLFASSGHYLAGITYDSRTLYQWYTPDGGLGNPTKITIPIGDPIKGISWLGTSKYLVLRSKQSGSTVAWRVEVWDMSGAVQATYTLPSTDTSWYGAIAQYPDGSGFYVAMGNSSTTGTIYRYNSSGVLQKQWTLPVTDYYGGSVPQAMAVDSSGNLYLSQAGNTRCYTPAGVAKWSLVGGFTSLTFDNIHGYLVEGMGQSVTWADPSTGSFVGATPVLELIQSLALMDFNGANLYVLSAIGPKIIVGEWSTPATEAGQSVVIDASSGTASFHNVVDVTSIISQYPMSQADGERVSGVHLASSLTDLNGVSTTHLLAGLSRGFIPKIASNQTDAGEYIWSGSKWVHANTWVQLVHASGNVRLGMYQNWPLNISAQSGSDGWANAGWGVKCPLDGLYLISGTQRISKPSGNNWVDGGYGVGDTEATVAGIDSSRYPIGLFDSTSITGPTVPQHINAGQVVNFYNWYDGTAPVMQSAAMNIVRIGN